MFKRRVSMGNDVVLELSGELARQAEVIALTDRDLAIAAGIKPYVELHIGGIVDRFYDAIGKESSLMDKIRAHSSIDRLRQMLQRHILEMLSGKIDGEYIARRQQVARTHLHIRLAAKWYIGSFAELERAIVEVCEYHFARKDMPMVRDAIRRLLSLEKQIVLEAFDDASDALKQEVSEKVASSASELASASEESSASIQQLAAQSQQIVGFARSVSEIASRVEQSATEGMQKLTDQLARLAGIQSDVKGIGEKIGPLKISADKIGSIASAVKEIAEKTNLLALNAAIQAAHAKEHGRGFAVVADEVKKLSVQTKEMASQVAEIVKSIQTEVHNVADTLPVISGNVDEASEGMNETHRFFASLVDEMATVSAKTGEIEQELSDSAVALEEVSKAIQHVSDSAEQLHQLSADL